MIPSSDRVSVEDLLRAWPLTGARVLNRLGGTNNRSHAVIASGGQYVLRHYENTANPDRLHYEHALLIALNRLEMPFAIPVPVPACNGETLVRVVVGENEVLAGLFPLLPGKRPRGLELDELSAAGAALGHLDRALHDVDIDSSGAPPLSGDLARIHPLVPDPLEMLGGLELEDSKREELNSIVSRLLASLPDLYRSLPRQIVHRDYDASNILTRRGHVTAVLDFEFAGEDLRIADLGRTIGMFNGHPWSYPNGGDRVITMCESYRHVVDLSPEELEALPQVMLLSRLISVIHREGRRRHGLATQSDVASRLDDLIRMEDWLRGQTGKLWEP